jgi:DNA-binding HxlR family transcriptional regulator
MPFAPDAMRLFEDVLGCKWTLGVLDALHAGTLRPGAIRRAIPGLTTKVLQQRLKKLERFGLIVRRLVADRPLHVEYRLTPKGRALWRQIAGVQRVAEQFRG